MLQMNLQLSMNTNQEVVNKIKETEAKVKKSKEVLPMDKAWEEIFSKKNSKTDLEKLQEVKVAMEQGKIGRELGKENKTFTKAEALRQHKVLMELTRGEKLEQLALTTPANYKLVTNMNELLSMREVLKREPIIAVDTETTGVDVYRDTIVGASFTAPSQDLHYYIPIAHDEQTDLNKDEIINVMKDILEMDTHKVFHNAIFDLHILKNENIDVNGTIHDTMIIMHLLNENEPSFRLKDLVKKYCKIPADNFDELFGKNCKFNTVELKYARYYACKDTDVTYKLYKFQMTHLHRPDLERVLNNYKRIEQPLIKVVFDMERVGFNIDFEAVEELRTSMNKRVEELKVELVKEFGDINLNSPVQLKEVLYGKKKLHLKMNSTFEQSTDKKALKALSKHCKGCEYLLEYKNLTKELSSFVEKIPTMISPDGKLHGSFKQTGTVTGRFSSSNPNLQQQSKLARKMFTADEGHLILGADFSAQEPRLLAHYTQDPILLDIYRRGVDLYSTYASLHYNRPYEEVYKNADGSDTKERKQFKVVILAIMYGMTEKSLAETLGIHELEAKNLIDSFMDGSPQVKQWIENNKKQARMLGYVETLAGRKRRLPEAKSSDKYIALRAERQSTNARIQGSASEQTKLVMIRANKVLKEMSTSTRRFELLATIHDEVLFQVPEDVTKEEVAVIEDIMINTVKLKNVPSKTDIEIGKCWGSLESYDDFFKNRG